MMTNAIQQLSGQLRARRLASTSPISRMIAQARPLHAFETEDPILARKPMRERKRRPSVASVIRQMQRAGVEVAGCEINPRDGTVKILTGKCDAPADRGEWN